MKIELRKIICPVDFSENAKVAGDYGLAFAETYDAELVLIHVVDSRALRGFPDDIVQQITRSHERSLKTLVEKARTRYARVSSRLVSGTPFLEIIRMARTENADLIVMGTHGRTALAHVLIGSVAERVVRKAPCPVLTVKHPEHEFVMP